MLTQASLHFENILTAGVKLTGSDQNDVDGQIGKKFVVIEKEKIAFWIRR